MGCMGGLVGIIFVKIGAIMHYGNRRSQTSNISIPEKEKHDTKNELQEEQMKFEAVSLNQYRHCNIKIRWTSLAREHGTLPITRLQ